MTFTWDLEKDKNYRKLDEIDVVGSIKLIGLFPYETKRIRGVKVPAEMYAGVLDVCRNVIDNKIVMVFNDPDAFGTAHAFGLFYHDGGCVIGEIEDIVDY